MFKHLLAGAAGLALVASAAGAQTTTLRYNNWIPATHFIIADGFVKYFEDIAKATEGRVKVELTAQSLGAPPRQMQLAVDGIAEFCPTF
jgi:TRAP-type C4-dicarboxylate transport system substrate-binding protein